MIESDFERSLLLKDFGVNAFCSFGVFRGIFDNQFVEVEMGVSAGVASSQPTFLCRTSDIKDLDVGEIISINNANYVVRVIMPDGTGFTTLLLEATV